MRDYVSEHAPLLQLLQTGDRTRRKALLDTLTRDEVNCLCECILNGISGGASQSLSPECIRHCRRHKDRIRSLAFDDKLGWKKKKAILRNQSGAGWFMPLLGAVISSLLMK